MVELISGRNNYGEILGIIMVKTSFPRIPGDIGNASTFNFPVRYKVIEEALPTRVVDEPDRALIPLFIEAAKELADDGVRAITTSCGFLALFQKEIAGAVDVPVFTSSLLQVPLASQMIGPDKKVGIVTANSEALTKDHLRAVGIHDEMPVVIAGMDDVKAFREAIGEHLTRPLVPEEVEAGLVSVCSELNEKQNLGAIVLECTNLSPYAKAVQETVRLPVFDITTLCNFIYITVLRRKFEGFL